MYALATGRGERTVSDSADLRLGAAGLAAGGMTLAIGGYIAYKSPGIPREIDTLLITLLITVLTEIGIVIVGIGYKFHKNFSIIRTARPIETTVKAEVIPGDIPAIKQGIPAIIRAIGPGRAALPAADGPQGSGAGQPPATGNGPQGRAPGAA
jgi:hypothetical protein